MEPHMRIKHRIEQYEEKMALVMKKGKEMEVRQVYDEFEKEVGQAVKALAVTAEEPLRSALMSLFDDVPTKKVG